MNKQIENIAFNRHNLSVQVNKSTRRNAMPVIISDFKIKSSENGLFCVNDLHKACGGENKHRPKYWLQLQQIQELIIEIEKGGIKAFYKKQGRNGGTYVCKELVYAYAMWVSPQFHVQVIRAFDLANKAGMKFDQLDNLMDRVKDQKNTLMESINKASMNMDELQECGSSWGQYGSKIKKARKECMRQLEDAKDRIQLQLDLM